jgi:fructose-bisphosphate aldolase class II
MALVPLRLLLDHAAENGYGIPAFNVNNLEQVQSIMEAASETDSPVILQASRGARQYAGENFLRHLILAAVETYPDIPVVMHQDHGNSPATCFGAAANGFTSVMMDGSLMADAKSPASYEYNVAVTKEVVDVAHAIGVSVEGELGCLGSLETGMGEAEDGHGFEGKLDHSQLLTDPAEAADFVAKTKVDALAIAIGTSHGAYKFTRKPTGEVLAISRIAEINKFGGAIPETYGVPVEEIQEGIRNGVRKVNIDTDNRLAFTAAVREAAFKDPANFDPRHFNKPARQYMKQVCLDRYQQFWCAGNASKIKQRDINYYAGLYAKGALDPKAAVAA